MKLEHVALNVPDPAATAEWYAESLGMRVVKASQESPFMHFVSDDSESMIEFYHNPAGAVPDYPAMSPYSLHLAFAVDDIPGVRDGLLAVGATLAGELETNPVGDQLLFLRDPWGVAIQLVKRARPLL